MSSAWPAPRGFEQFLRYRLHLNLVVTVVRLDSVLADASNLIKHRSFIELELYSLRPPGREAGPKGGEE